MFFTRENEVNTETNELAAKTEILVSIIEEEVAKRSEKFLELIEKIITELEMSTCNRLTQKLNPDDLIKLVPGLIESAATTTEIRTAYLLAKDGSMMKCEALSKWDRLAWIQTIQARTLEESLISYFHSPTGSIAKELALKNSIGFLSSINNE